MLLFLSTFVSDAELGDLPINYARAVKGQETFETSGGHTETSPELRVVVGGLGAWSGRSTET